ncbi:MAG: type II toxin-antitoxin system RelE/ParE family toxin [Desulfuromusa sp.]|jgi:toxin ParE1/3/4|nr:type II toxin-antitoxin system RelE/ParE family toxin [Desulfuromusa sp.]
MASLTLTEAAKGDLKNIARFTQSRWNREQRNNYLKILDSNFCQLANNPAMGMACNEIKAGYYKFPAESHMIFYRKRADQKIEIVRVLHKSMDVEIQLSKS